MGLAAPLARRTAAACLLVALAGLPAGCTLFQRSTENVDQVPDEGFLQFVGGTRDDRIFVDGKEVGTGDEFAEDRLLAVRTGAHLVEVMNRGTMVRQERVYLGTGNTRRVAIR
jgi:hypothetical protein